VAFGLTQEQLAAHDRDDLAGCRSQPRTRRAGEGDAGNSHNPCLSHRHLDSSSDVIRNIERGMYGVEPIARRRMVKDGE
jgi:hypothetical protein